jgi:hypothetical protein
LVKQRDDRQIKVFNAPLLVRARTGYVLVPPTEILAASVEPALAADEVHLAMPISLGVRMQLCDREQGSNT